MAISNFSSQIPELNDEFFLLDKRKKKEHVIRVLPYFLIKLPSH